MQLEGYNNHLENCTLLTGTENYFYHSLKLQKQLKYEKSIFIRTAVCSSLFLLL